MYNRIGRDFYSSSSAYLEITKQRTLVFAVVFLIMFAALIARLAIIMIVSKSSESLRKDSSAPVIISRADIVDRNGIVIATSLPTVSIYASTHEILDTDDAVNKLVSVFKEISKDDLKRKISSTNKFIWIKRNLTPLQEQKILNQGIPGVHFLRAERRVYPDRNLVSHVIGGTDVDNVGIAGIEKVFDETLRSSSNPLVLSIDMKIQHAVHDELGKSISEFSALGGAAVVMNISTGEIISFVSLPDFDLNKNSDPKAKERFNMVTSSAIEPGSSAKIFNTAMALEYKKVTPLTKFDARFPLKIGRFTVHDFKGKATFLSVEEILKYSSNIGSGRIALAVGTSAQKKFFKHIGLLDSVSCELLETQKPIYPKQWTDASTITISYGHGIAFSPLHLITVFSGILNDGILNIPTLLKRERSCINRRIVSKKTSNLIKALIRLCVTEGTNKFANVEGYCVGGKSGTAEKLVKGKYSKKLNYGSFLGAFPMTSPKYAVYVVLNEPKATAKTHGYATGGWNAAPTVASIIRRIGPMLGVITVDDSNINWKSRISKEMAKNEKPLGDYSI